MLKYNFTPANFFLALLFRQTTWKVCLFKVDAFKRENARFYRTWHHLQHFWLLNLEIAVPELLYLFSSARFLQVLYTRGHGNILGNMHQINIHIHVNRI